VLELDENELAKLVVNIAFEIHVKLGPGLYESVYEEILFNRACKMWFTSGKAKKQSTYIGIMKE
jgi:hypothetical protein